MARRGHRRVRRRATRRRCSPRACAIAAVERGGFALVRPPGPPRAARSRDGLLPLRQRRDRRPLRPGRARLERVAIVDWDVHHGNGTQEIFWDDDSVFFVSLHQWPFYPGTGGPGDAGRDDAERAARRPARATRSTLRAFDDVVEPAVRAFEPELVLVSAGFDAHVDDPLAEHARHRRRVPRARPPAAQPWRRSVAAVLEGGYNLETLPGLVAAALEGFSRNDKAGPSGGRVPRRAEPPRPSSRYSRRGASYVEVSARRGRSAASPGIPHDG